MSLNEIGELVLKQAEDKGWGHTKEMLNVAEKMMLINTEVTEFHDAMNLETDSPKDTINAESADILMRTLHLGLVWGVDFDEDISFESKYRGKKIDEVTDSDYLYLHSLISVGYDQYRHKDFEGFKKSLYIIAKEIQSLTKEIGKDIESACLEKININRSRVWDKNELMGNYYKGKP
ncbi:MAG: hypothetical protein ACD_61C00053G0013 [uncultured bacterium]|nr:MAG: hypothetical protein ACD_61C00053G0013 [uncultured bacterium]